MNLYEFCFISKLTTSEILLETIKDEEMLGKFIKNLNKNLSVKGIKIFKDLMKLDKINVKYFNFIFSYVYSENAFNENLSIERFLDLKVKARKLFYDTIWDKKSDFVKMDTNFDNYFNKVLPLITEEIEKETKKRAKYEIEASMPCERQLRELRGSCGYTEPYNAGPSYGACSYNDRRNC